MAFIAESHVAASMTQHGRSITAIILLIQLLYHCYHRVLPTATGKKHVIGASWHLWLVLWSFLSWSNAMMHVVSFTTALKPVTICVHALGTSMSLLYNISAVAKAEHAALSMFLEIFSASFLHTVASPCWRLIGYIIF
jgi:hypothetical protein